MLPLRRGMRLSTDEDDELRRRVGIREAGVAVARDADGVEGVSSTVAAVALSRDLVRLVLLPALGGRSRDTGPVRHKCI